VQFAPGQRPDSFPVFAILGMDATAEPAIGINPQMVAGAVVAAHGAGRAPGLEDVAGQFANIFQLGHVEAHT
jgi:hypothetical protein